MFESRSKPAALHPSSKPPKKAIRQPVKSSHARARCETPLSQERLVRGGGSGHEFLQPQQLCILGYAKPSLSCHVRSRTAFLSALDVQESQQTGSIASKLETTKEGHTATSEEQPCQSQMRNTSIQSKDRRVERKGLQHTSHTRS